MRSIAFLFLLAVIAATTNGFSPYTISLSRPPAKKASSIKKDAPKKEEKVKPALSFGFPKGKEATDKTVNGAAKKEKVSFSRKPAAKKESVTKKDAPKKVSISRKPAAKKESSTAKDAPKKVSFSFKPAAKKESATEKDAPKKASFSFKPAAKKESSTKKPAAKKVTAKKVVPKAAAKVTTKKIIAPKAAAKKVTVKKIIAPKAAPKKAKKVLPLKTVGLAGFGLNVVNSSQGKEATGKLVGGGLKLLQAVLDEGKKTKVTTQNGFDDEGNPQIVITNVGLKELADVASFAGAELFETIFPKND